MGKFKVGDIVRCADECDTRYFTKGKEYVVTVDEGEDGFFGLDDDHGDDRSRWSRYYTRVSSAPVTPPTHKPPEDLEAGDWILWHGVEGAGGWGPHMITAVDVHGSFSYAGDCNAGYTVYGGGFTIVPPPQQSTNTTTHPTGAVRESKEGKGRPDLLLAGFPRALMALCRHMDCELGRERNWEKGLPESSLISSQFRHLLGYASGVSEDTPEYNLTAAAWNAFVALEEYLRVQDGVMVDSVLDIAKGT